LGSPVKVTEQSAGGPIVYENYEMKQDSVAGTPVSTGELEVRAQITVDYNF